MGNQDKHTISDVYHDYKRNKLGEELYGEWAAVIFYRGPAIILTPCFLKFSIRPTTVTVISLFVVLVMPVTVLIPPYISFICLALMGVIFNVLDCIDGNIARITNSTSRTGQYLDFIADIIQRIILYLTLGALVEIEVVNNSGEAGAFALTAVAALLAIVARLSREYCISGFAGSVTSAVDSGIKDESAKAGTVKVIIERGLFPFVSGLDTLTPILILVSVLAGNISWLPYWLLFYSLLDFTYTQYSVIRKIR